MWRHVTLMTNYKYPLGFRLGGRLPGNDLQEVVPVVEMCYIPTGEANYKFESSLSFKNYMKCILCKLQLHKVDFLKIY